MFFHFQTIFSSTGISPPPTQEPTKDPTQEPTKDPTQETTKDPTQEPTSSPFQSNNPPTKSEEELGDKAAQAFIIGLAAIRGTIGFGIIGGIIVYMKFVWRYG